jgi:hypothetical protein
MSVIQPSKKSSLLPTGAGIDLRCILEDIHLKLSSHASRVSSPVVAG